MTSERRAALSAGALVGFLLIFVDAMALRLIGATAAGVLLIRWWSPASGKAIPPTEGARMGVVTGLVVGVVRQFMLLVLVIIGVIIDPTPSLMQPPSDMTLHSFQEEWGYNYYNFHVLFDVFGSAVGAGLGAFLGVQFYETPSNS